LIKFKGKNYSQGASMMAAQNAAAKKEAENKRARNARIPQYEQMMNILMVFDILKRHSDVGKPIEKQTQIAKLIKKEYSVEIDRKAIRRNLLNLETFLEKSDFGYRLGYEEKELKNGKVKFYNWYLEQDITDAELQLLVDGLLFSKYIPYSQCKELVKKLENLSGNRFNLERKLPENMPVNNHIFYTIEILIEAIRDKRMVSFNGLGYGTNKNPQNVTKIDGTAREYNVSPYEIVIKNGRYYLIHSYDTGGLYTFRLDYIRQIEFYEAGSYRPINAIKGYEHGLDLAKFMKEHIYMYGGDSARVKLRAFKKVERKGKPVDSNIVGSILDWFGNDVSFTEESEDEVIAYITVNEQAMLYWALQYGKTIEIQEPLTIREEVRKAAELMLERYVNKVTKP